MTFDSFDQLAVSAETNRIDGIRQSLNKAFDSGFSGDADVLMNENSDGIDINIAEWLGHADLSGGLDGITSNRGSIFEIIDEMFNGREIDDSGRRSLGLNDLSQYRINPEYRNSNIRQQAGFAAEIIATARENAQALLDGTGTRSYRVDDLPSSVRQELRDLGDTYDYATRNDQYVDRIRILVDGTIERIQTKFVGSDAASCLGKIMSRGYDRYFEDTVDGSADGPRILQHIEIPSEFYDEIINDLIPAERQNFLNQLEQAVEGNNAERIERIQAQIDRLDERARMLEPSSVTLRDAVFARMHPNVYSAAMFAGRSLRAGLQEGLEGAVFAAAITAGVSTVDNYRAVMSGEMSIQEAFLDVASDAGVAGVAGFVPDFISGTVNAAFSQSSHTLMRTLGNYNIPAAVITFGIDSYDEVSAYAAGQITGGELAYRLGDNLAETIGATAGGAIGLASPIPGGTLIGSIAGAALASKAYETTVELAIEYGPEAVAAVDAAIENLSNDMHETIATSVELVGEGAAVLENQISEIAPDVSEVVSEVGEQLSDIGESVIENIQEGAEVVTEVAEEAATSVGTVATEVTEVSVEYIEQLADAAQTYGQQAIELGNQAIDYIQENMPDQVDSVVNALNTFAAENGLSFSWG